MKNSQNVVLIQRRITHYRQSFFEILENKLDAIGVSLKIAAGTPTESEVSKNDSGSLPNSINLSSKYFFANKVCWQPVHRNIGGADLVILPQENSLLANHLLLLLRPKAKLAFWGHGANLQAPNKNSLSERYKRWTTRQVDWWFAYTQMSVDLVRNAGFPSDRITCLNNSIDVEALRADAHSIQPHETATLRASLGMARGFTGVFIGSLYAHKRLDFLFEAADQIRSIHPDFSLLIIGTGPQLAEVQAKAAQRPWVHMAGARHGREKALYLSLADVMLNPGLVGLNILDSFACRLPMLTTDCGLHSPEVAYLDESNGVMTPDSLDAYVQACNEVATSPARLEALRQGCAVSSQAYSVEAMAENFAAGIVAALETPKLKRKGLFS